LNRIVTLGTLVLFPLAGLAQEAAAGRQDSPFLTGLITWAPFLFLIGLWWFFMKRMNVFGKRGYADYMRLTQERMERIRDPSGRHRVFLAQDCRIP
jgi:ATP-dependent Zn protease